MAEKLPRQYAPRYRTASGAPGRKCTCGHREGTHNDLGYCQVERCTCSIDGGWECGECATPHGGLCPEPGTMADIVPDRNGQRLTREFGHFSDRKSNDSGRP